MMISKSNQTVSACTFKLIFTDSRCWWDSWICWVVRWLFSWCEFPFWNYCGKESS